METTWLFAGRGRTGLCVLPLLALTAVSLCGCDALMSLPGFSGGVPPQAASVRATQTPTLPQSATANPASASVPKGHLVTVTGKVETSRGEAIVTATATEGAMFAHGSDTTAVRTQLGSFLLSGAPTGVDVKISLKFPNGDSISTSIVPVPNPSRDENVNKVDLSHAFPSPPGGSIRTPPDSGNSGLTYSPPSARPTSNPLSPLVQRVNTCQELSRKADEAEAAWLALPRPVISLDQQDFSENDRAKAKFDAAYNAWRAAGCR